MDVATFFVCCYFFKQSWWVRRILGVERVWLCHVICKWGEKLLWVCVLFFNLHYRMISPPPPMSSFYLACTGVFISSINKMLCFSDGFLQVLLFSIIVMLQAACHLWKGALGSLLGSNEVGSQSSALSAFSSIVNFFEQPRIQEERTVCNSPCRGRGHIYGWITYSARVGFFSCFSWKVVLLPLSPLIFLS